MKKLLKITLALMMALGLQLTSLKAVNALNSDLSKVGTYQIPIKSLTSSAPMPVVKTAFAKAFGDTLEVTVDKDGKMQAVATLQNMIINMGSEYYANVLTISNGTTLSTKVEKYTQGMNGPTVETEVPEKISFELTQLDENNSTVLPITVDFMNALMGNGKDYPTNVALTLDLENAKVLQKEYTLEDGTYKEVTVIEEENDHPTKVQFKLDENKELINVNFYYGGSSRASTARLQLKLDGLTKVDPTPETPKNDNDDIKEENKKEEEVTTRFSKDGTYEVNVALWNATSDKESMAADALNNKAKIIVKDGKATMYISTKEMTFGTIKASLQEFYIGNSSSDYKNHSATIIEKDAQGNPTLWSFELPHENEYIDVMMNPHVAMMGNMDLGARIKVDYATLTYVSNQTKLETNTGNNQKENNSVENTNSKDQTTTNNQTNENKVVKTGDQTAINMMAMLLIISSIMTGVILRKKHEA